MDWNNPLPQQCWDEPNFRLEDVINKLGRRIVNSGDAEYSIVSERNHPTDCSGQTGYFDWHSDGLYHKEPPRYVMLHCIDPGASQCPTELSETKTALSQMRHSHVMTLSKLRTHYVGRQKTYVHDIMSDNGMLLASRGHVSPMEGMGLKDQPTVREITSAMTGLYTMLDNFAGPVWWKKGRTLVFDQYQYLHRRNSKVIDPNRKLIRLWFR